MSHRLLWTLMPVMLVLFLTVFGWFALKAEQLLTSEVEKRLHREATVVRETVKATYGAYVANEKVLNRALKSMYMQQASFLSADGLEASQYLLRDTQVEQLSGRQVEDRFMNRMDDIMANDVSVSEQKDVFIVTAPIPELKAHYAIVVMKQSVLGTMWNLRELVFVAITVMLVMMIGLFSFMIRREIKPLTAFAVRLRESVATRSFSEVELHAKSFEMRSLEREYNTFIGLWKRSLLTMLETSTAFESSLPVFMRQLEANQQQVTGFKQVAATVASTSQSYQSFTNESTLSAVAAIEAIRLERAEIFNEMKRFEEDIFYLGETLRRVEGGIETIDQEMRRQMTQFQSITEQTTATGHQLLHMAEANERLKEVGVALERKLDELYEGVEGWSDVQQTLQGAGVDLGKQSQRLQTVLSDLAPTL